MHTNQHTSLAHGGREREREREREEERERERERDRRLCCTHTHKLVVNASPQFFLLDCYIIFPCNEVIKALFLKESYPNSTHTLGRCRPDVQNSIGMMSLREHLLIRNTSLRLMFGRCSCKYWLLCVGAVHRPFAHVKSSQVTFIYIALLTIQIVTKQLHNIKMRK